MKKLFILLAALFMFVACYDYTELINRIEALEKAGYQSQLEALKTSVASLVSVDAVLNNTIMTLLENDEKSKEQIKLLESIDKSLNAEITALESQVVALQELLEQESSDMEDWVEKTFATLEQYEAVVEDLTELNDFVLEEISDINTTIVSNYSALSEAIASSKSSIEDWVETTLETYCTEVDTKISALKTELESLQSDLEALDERVVRLEELICLILDHLSINYLSISGTANSYIVSEAGNYIFKATKGNSNEPVGTISSVVVLWETFGTDVTPNVGDLISTVSYADGNITFSTNSVYKEGNALIAAKDANGTILWSWHIWFTDKPKDQVYNNNAGIMMDRNLGATSATKGDVGALGLLYQWGRKDPFLSGESVSSDTPAASTLESWSTPVSSDASNGTISYATASPTTFITYNSRNYDWYYTGTEDTDNTRWQSTKTIYDPCPVGYRVPDGGSSGVWSTAFGTSNNFHAAYDDINEGFDFGTSETYRHLTNEETCWYPAAGYLYSDYGRLYIVGDYGFYWSCAPIEYGYDAYNLGFRYDGYVSPSYSDYRAYGYSVRCLKE